MLLAHERAFVGKSDLLAVLQEEIIAVIAKHVTIERDRVQIKLDRGDPISTLEIDVEVPSAAAAAALRAGAAGDGEKAEALCRRQQRDGEFGEDRRKRQAYRTAAESRIADPVTHRLSDQILGQMQRRVAPHVARGS